MNLTHLLRRAGRAALLLTLGACQTPGASGPLLGEKGRVTPPQVLVGAGDIASCASDRDEATAKMLEGIEGTSFTLGEQLPRLRLQVLARKVLERLRGGLPADTEDARIRHALQMASLVHHNRRALRRLLARYFSGERDFIEQHPVSRAWFARHPRVEREKWLKGVVLRREVPGMGEVTLSLEQDALEALRLGTHVGSCLGLNGICDYSAAAVVLDINKRVLHARDSRGRVLARQLLAISRDDTLVPFKVYPESCPQALQSVFLDYDLAFAETLGLPLSEGPEEPEVEHVLSTEFWHDGSWEICVPV